MTEVLFYHLQDTTLERVLPPLLEKSLERGWRVAIQAGSQERLEALDTHLWTYRDDSFLPHGTLQDGDPGEQAILLTADEGNPSAATVRFLVDRATLPQDCASYTRVVLIFDGDDDEALQRARAAWTEGETKGFDLTYWQPDEQGRWQRRK